MEVTGVVVARKGSIRIQNKSMLILNGETLIERKIKQLLNSEYIDKVVFGSDCEEMLALAEKCGASPVRRPDYYCDETKATANDMIGNMCSLFTTDVVVWAHCTNPLISAQTYDNAIKMFLNNNDYDSLLSIVEIKEHLWDENKKPLNYNPYSEKHVVARELKPYYMQDGGIFIQPHKQMLQNSYFFGKKPYLFEIPKEEFLDINNERDYITAKAIIEGNK